MNYLDQLPLSLRLQDDALFQNFYVGFNQQVIQVLSTLIAKKLPESFVYCYGQNGVGRSHLLQACCHAAHQQKHTAFYLPLMLANEFSPDILNDLDNVSLLCIDDVDAVMGQREWEEALFHCYNRIRDKFGRLLFSAQCSPKQLTCQLPDLQTRLSSSLILEIVDLNDEGKIQALQMRAKDRGFTLTDEVSQFLLRHYSRNMSHLIAVLDRLDHASLIAKRKLTIPFVKSVIG